MCNIHVAVWCTALLYSKIFLSSANLHVASCLQIYGLLKNVWDKPYKIFDTQQKFLLYYIPHDSEVCVAVCSVEEFVTAVKEVRALYLALPPETQCDTIIADFDARWEKGQADFLNRPSRFFY